MSHAADGLAEGARHALGAQPATPRPEPEQLDLLGLPPIRGANGEVAVRRPGRAPGTRNKRTQEWIDHLLARYPSPLEGLLQMAWVTVDEYRRSIGCSALEAFEIKRKAMEAALPYLHPRLASVELMRAGDPRGSLAGTLSINEIEAFDVTSELDDNLREGVKE